MAFDWEHVEAIRAGQDSARNRRDLNTLPTNEVSNEIYNSPSGREAKIPGLDHWEQMIHKVRTQLIDYIIEHGLVQGFEYDGINEPIKNGKIIITAEMLQRVTDRFGYFKEKETLEFIKKYLPEHHYVSDADYVHTDNNYTDEEKAKLKGIEDGAEVNKVISILFNGVETIDPTTRVATITITPADIKAWYEQNPDTNVFTDAEKAKLESISIEELSNKVIDVTLDGESVVKDKIAILTAKKIKDSYESNADTNAFTDADKALVEQVLPEVQKGVNQHEQRIDALEKSQTAQDTEIVDTKNSISELGDEVNSVAGRVTNLETSQTEQDKKIEGFVPYEGAIKDVILENHALYVSTQMPLDNGTTSARIAIGKTMEQEIPEPGLTAQVSGEFTLDNVPNEDTTNVSVASSEASISIESIVNNTLAQGMRVLIDVHGIHIIGTQNPTQVNISPGVITGLDAPINDPDAANKAYVDANAGKVDDVQVDGTSVVVDKVAKIPYIPTSNDMVSLIKNVVVNNYVPYIGANKDINIGQHGITAEGRVGSTGFYANNVFYQSGIGYQGYDADGNVLGFGGISVGSLSPGYPYTTLRLFNTIPPESDKSATLDEVRIVLFRALSGDSIIELNGKQNKQNYDFKLRGVGSPVGDNDATNKKYVDDKIATLKATIDDLTARITALESK